MRGLIYSNSNTLLSSSVCITCQPEHNNKAQLLLSLHIDSLCLSSFMTCLGDGKKIVVREYLLFASTNIFFKWQMLLVCFVLMQCRLPFQDGDEDIFYCTHGHCGGCLTLSLKSGILHDMLHDLCCGFYFSHFALIIKYLLLCSESKVPDAFLQTVGKYSLSYGNICLLPI